MSTTANQSTPLSFGIVGAGAIGSGLGGLLATAGRRVTCWDIDPAKCTAASLRQLVGDSDVIFLCVSTAILPAVAREVVTAMEPSAAPHKLMVTVAKGVGEGFATADALLEQAAAGRCDTALFYGPMLAAEVVKQGRLAGVLASASPRWRGRLDGAFGLASRVDYSDAPRSIALCGVFKNVYSVGFGLAAGLGWGNNDRGRLLVAVMSELRRLLSELGGQPADADGLAGLGDLLATGSGELSFNFRAGLALARGEAAKGEGVNSLRVLSTTRDTADYPVLDTLRQIVVAARPPESLENLLR